MIAVPQIARFHLEQKQITSEHGFRSVAPYREIQCPPKGSWLVKPLGIDCNNIQVTEKE